MVDPRVIHSITIEMCTGFLLLAGVAVAAKVAGDWWLRNLRGKVARFDHWAMAASRFAEPTSYFALVAGVLATFASMVTGSLAWPASELWASETVHNKILITAASQTIFIGAIALRARYRFEIWFVRGTGGLYALLILTGDALMTLQNSIAGHLAGKGSLLDEFLHSLNINTHPMWVFPAWASVPILVGFPVAASIAILRLRAAERRRVPEAMAAV